MHLCSPPYYFSNHEPEMKHQSYRHSIVPVHYFEAFFERFFVVDGGLAFLHVVCHDGMYVSQQEMATLSFFHDFDTPIHVGRVSIFGVEWNLAGYVSTGVEGLMTNQHSVPERFPR